MVKYISFYLPQFHQIKENDQWWGKGFTDWNNVKQAKPRFKYHYQPHVPSELGYYDLKDNQVMIQQAELAKEFGVYGFCYYHYWFKGKRLLNEPVDNMLSSGQPDFPFCLCWANENWTRIWDGQDNDMLIKQEYSDDDNKEHIHWLCKMFSDKRYIKIDGKPVFLIYRPLEIPNLSEFILFFRSEAKKHGFDDVYLCAVISGFNNKSDDAFKKYFDACVDFQPNRNDFPVTNNLRSNIFRLARNVLPKFFYEYLKRTTSVTKIINYKDLVISKINKDWFDFKTFPVVFPSWDNSARRNTPTIIQNNDSEKFNMWLQHGEKVVSEYPENEQFIFVNAWNEWAEGCHLEPDIKNGKKFLKVIQKLNINKSQSQ